jgi:hypothetical protein
VAQNEGEINTWVDRTANGLETMDGITFHCQESTFDHAKDLFVCGGRQLISEYSNWNRENTEFYETATSCWKKIVSPMPPVGGRKKIFIFWSINVCMCGTLTKT